MVLMTRMRADYGTHCQHFRINAGSPTSRSRVLIQLQFGFVFVLYALKDFFTMYRDIVRRIEPQSHLSTTDIYHG
jgi:hypothetical protein